MKGKVSIGARGVESVIILELFVITLIGALIYAIFSHGVSWIYVQFIAVLIFIGMFFPLVLETKVRGICIVNAKSAVFFGILAWILMDPLTLREGIEEFAAETFLKGLLIIIIFMVMVNFGYFLRWPDFFTRLFRRLDYGYSFNRKKIFYFIVISGFIGLLPVMIWGGGLKNVIWILTHGVRFMAPWERGRVGGWEDYFKTGATFLNILVIQLIWFYSIFIRRNLGLLILAGIELWLIFNTGTRTNLGGALIPLLALYYLYLFNRKQRARYWVIVFLYLLLTVMQFQFIVRECSMGKSLVEVARESFLPILRGDPREYQRDNQFYRLLKVVETVPEKLPYSGEALILRPLYHYIPRAIWKNKPMGVTGYFETAMKEPGVGVTTFAVSMPGEFYLCQGWLGVCIAGIFMGFLAKQFDSLVDMSKRSPAVLLVYAYGITFLFVSIRSYQVIFGSWYVFIFMYLALAAARKKGPILWKT